MAAGRAAAAGTMPFPAIEAGLDREVRSRFPGVKRIHAYGMKGWQVKRPVAVPWTRGTIDPNFVTVFLAQRRQGVTLHLWNPYDYTALQKRRAGLEKAGFKVMVGCLQFTRKQPYPLSAVTPLLDGIRAAMDRDKGEQPSRPSPSRKTGNAARKPAKADAAARTAPKAATRATRAAPSASATPRSPRPA